MNEAALRQELFDFYRTGDGARAEAFAALCFEKMDAEYREGMSVLAQKRLQYQVISREFTPVIFPHSPYFYETGVLTSLSDGAFTPKGYSFVQANGWVYQKNQHLFYEQDEELTRRRLAHGKEKLYLICGPFNDVKQHFNFHCRPILEGGLVSLYERAKDELSRAETPEEKDFLISVCEGMLAMKRMAEAFSKKAGELLLTEKDPECRRNLTRIAETACRVPWEAPETLYEALATLAFLRTAFGSLEGAGPNTFGRLDRDLISFYRADLDRGRITQEEAYELICGFLLLWDCHYDHDMKMEGYADHELENTYTLGGCDPEGNPVCNEITFLFLRATREKGIIFPKIKCRFGQNSPTEYLEELSRAIVAGTSVVLLQNDDATIPALVRGGKTLEEARDYLITGCWGLGLPQEKYDHGSYLNLLKALQYPIHGPKETCEAMGLSLLSYDDCSSFEEFYRRLLKNCEAILDAKLAVTRAGAQIFGKVTQFPIFSATLENCLARRADFTTGGAKYYDDYQLMFGFPNLVDSLLAVKHLVFDTGTVSLAEYWAALRANWQGYEDLRRAVLACPGWGDGREESIAMGQRLMEDLYAVCRSKKGTYGGRVHMGHLTYTEILFWGEAMPATPDGRKSGECFSQGLTPSRLKKIASVNDVIRSMAALDASMIGANSVVNLILPPKFTPALCAGFLRAVSRSAVQSLQLNCFSREMLLEAREHPEQYPDLVIRVTGFSAKFTSLSPRWQEEILSRNFYE